MTFVKRHIDVQFQLASGSFDAGGDTVSLSGLRVGATVNKAGGASMTKCDLKIWGMSLDVMNKLTILGTTTIQNRKNKVTVSAGDENSGLAAIFSGTLQEAWVDATNAPNVAFVVSALSGGTDALKPVQPVSFNGTVDAALIVSSIAATAGYNFENSGVSVQIPNAYLPGTMLSQLQSVARAGNFNAIIDNDTVAIWPAGQARKGEIPLISPDTGLVGYPMRTQAGIQFTTLFNPSISFGGTIRLQSSITPANGTWQPNAVVHDLEAEVPGGKWYTIVDCNTFGQGS